eukprot:6082867-Amphidinium_carterae.1
MLRLLHSLGPALTQSSDDCHWWKAHVYQAGLTAQTVGTTPNLTPSLRSWALFCAALWGQNHLWLSSDIFPCFRPVRVQQVLRRIS